ncbi:kinase [Thalassotalea profundi]|uniref:Kinase n=1 Tax=Thalassotalea profundi TaxID=2036687 RepID=A0ABQ3IXB3_9GAMM|nr:kinase [Thalassotalea profundi]GHE97391.1 kinase [Thalassotalea profundi]
MLATFIEQHHLPDTFEQTINRYYQPIAEQLLFEYQNSMKPLFVGINGCQGSGKSTFAAYLAEYLGETKSLNVVVMSLDDFYLSSSQRQQLAQSIHPLLSTRGVPGTHDSEAMADIFRKFTSKTSGFLIPRFNKAMDEPYEKSLWQQISQPVDIVLFEGWCWGVEAQSTSQLNTPINTLEKTHDPEGIWRNYVNQQLKDHYQPLYQYMNYWLVLQAPSFDCVYQWRLEQEEKLAKKTKLSATNKVMTPEQVFEFIQYFQRLTEHGIATLGQSADGVLVLDSKRNIIDFACGETK